MSAKCWTYEVLSEYSEQGKNLDYNQLVNFTLPDNDPVRQEISLDPYWALAVVRLGVPVSFNRAKLESFFPISEGAHLRGPTLVISEDCTNINISGTKRSHLKTLNATLAPGRTDYRKEILPDDWIFAWMVHGKDKYDELIERIKNPENDAPNRFLDGFKFMGRVDNVFKNRSVTPDGMKSMSFEVSATGFKELNSQFFYDRNLSEQDIAKSNLGVLLYKMGLNINELFNQYNKKQGNVNILVSSILDLMLGRGISAALNPAASAGLSSATGLMHSEDAPFAYLVPRQAALYVGFKSTGDQEGYANLVTLLQGCQQYEKPGFLPEVQAAGEIRLKCTEPLIGSFLPLVSDFANRPIWDLLQQYVNPTINELYTCLKIREVKDGSMRVVPTIVFRQIPFTTNAFKKVIRTCPSGPAVNQPTASTVPVAPSEISNRWEAIKAKGESLGFRAKSTTKGLHNKGSKHYVGRAVDFSVEAQQTSTLPAPDGIWKAGKSDIQIQGFLNAMRAAGFYAKYEDKRPPGQKQWSAPHIHVEDLRPDPPVAAAPVDSTPNAIESRFSSSSERKSTTIQDSDIPVTYFLDMPRWKIGSSMVTNETIGRSNATRCNFVHIYGQDAQSGTNQPVSFQIVRNPPVRDNLDIQRSGLSSYMTTVACKTVDELGLVPSNWIALVADRMMGSQLTLNGSITTIGIQAPICEGDNIEWDGVAYHIESINHTANIDYMGMKHWTTTLTISNGIAIEDLVQDDGTVNNSVPNYPDVQSLNGTSDDPGLTVERSRTQDTASTRTSDLVGDNIMESNDTDDTEETINQSIKDASRGVGTLPFTL